MIVVLFLSGVCGQNESDRDMYEDSDDEENDENDTHEAFLVAESDFADHYVEEILGDKKNTKWLLVDNQYICHKHKGCPKKNQTGQKWILDFEHEGLVSGGCPFYSLVYS